jgi:hypothetical protein
LLIISERVDAKVLPGSVELPPFMDVHPGKLVLEYRTVTLKGRWKRHSVCVPLTIDESACKKAETSTYITMFNYNDLAKIGKA